MERKQKAMFLCGLCFRSSRQVPAFTSLGFLWWWAGTCKPTNLFLPKLLLVKTAVAVIGNKLRWILRTIQKIGDSAYPRDCCRSLWKVDPALLVKTEKQIKPSQPGCKETPAWTQAHSWERAILSEKLISERVKRGGFCLSFLFHFFLRVLC